MAVRVVVECSNRFHRSKRVSCKEFLPTRLTIYGEREFELLAKRRVASVTAISKEDLDGNIVENYQIRSRQFVYW